LRRKRLRRDAWVKAAFAAGISVAAIAQRQQKSRQWVYQRLEAMGCPASTFPHPRRRRRPNQGPELP
jgi:hypothetical protein